MSLKEAMDAMKVHNFVDPELADDFVLIDAAKCDTQEDRAALMAAHSRVLRGASRLPLPVPVQQMYIGLAVADLCKVVSKLGA